MSAEVDMLLQEAKESIEAAQNYRSELQQRLHGLNQARKQVPAVCPVNVKRLGPRETISPISRSLSAISSFLLLSRSAQGKQCCYFLLPWTHGKMMEEKEQRLICRKVNG